MLKIYSLEGFGNYSGGLSIVAANDLAEAMSLANDYVGRYQDLRFGKQNSRELAELAYEGSDPKVICQYII